MSGKPVPLSLRRKSSARLAAVQCLYRVALTGGTDISATTLVDDYLEHWQNDREDSPRTISREAEPDKSFFRKLLGGILEKKEEIDTRLRASLSDKWTMERTSPLLIAILTAAIYELQYAGTLKAPIVIDEYVTLTGHFFGAQEVGFVNGLLDTLAKQNP